MRKIIGIPGYKVGDAYGAGLNHLEFLNTFANVRIIMPWENPTEVCNSIDMLYLPGGMDLNPVVYGQVPSFKTGNQDVFKQYFYDAKLNHYIDYGIPIFGVCLGMQELAAYFGSKITQDLKFHAQSSDRWETAHYIYNVANIKTKFKVNSHHHQCVLGNDLSKELVPLYFAEWEDGKIYKKDDVIIEAFKHETLPIYAVQWHPEELYDNFSVNCIKQLLEINDKVKA